MMRGVPHVVRGLPPCFDYVDVESIGAYDPVASGLVTAIVAIALHMHLRIIHSYEDHFGRYASARYIAKWMELRFALAQNDAILYLMRIIRKCADCADGIFANDRTRDSVRAKRDACSLRGASVQLTGDCGNSLALSQAFQRRRLLLTIRRLRASQHLPSEPRMREPGGGTLQQQVSLEPGNRR